MTTRHPGHVQAIWMLLLANLFWGLSFPLVKALVPLLGRIVPEGGNWFVTAMLVAPRFLLATAVLLLVAGVRRTDFTRRELQQGVVLGVTAGLGMLFQNDGLQFTSASVSAFLTQFYAIMIPVVLAVRARKLPGAVIWVCGVLVITGVGILAGFDFRTMHLGRGEIETLVCSVFFMGQIFALEAPRYAGNRVLPVTIGMFGTEALLFTGLAFATAPTPGDFFLPWTSGPWLGLTGLLTVFCTLAAFLIMNRWQPYISATEAGLIYCMEPVFTAIMALFLPAVFSRWAGVDYGNESLTWHLLLGGGLITLANVLLQLRPPPRPAAG